MTFKICVVCCGNIAFQMHGYAYKKYAELNGGTILSACCDIDETRARAFAGQFGFEKYYTDYRLMLAAEKPDAVCLNAPVKLTAALAVEILEAGFPLIMEKPPGLNREETLRILAAAEKGKIPHQVAFNRRFIPVVDCLVRDLRNAQGSAIQNIGCEFFRVGRTDPDFCTTAIHAIDTVRYAAGSDFREINFFYQELSGAVPGVANFYLQGSFQSGAHAQLRVCPMTGVTVERLTVNVKGRGADDTYIAFLPFGDSLDSPGKLLHYKNDELVKEVSGEELCGGKDIFMTNGFYAEDASFFDHVKAGKQPEADLRSAVQSVEIADCLRKRLPVYRGAN